MTIEFLLTTLIVVISPGTGVLFTLATGLSRGGRASAVAAFGCTLGIVSHMAGRRRSASPPLLHESAAPSPSEPFKYARRRPTCCYMAWKRARASAARCRSKSERRRALRAPGHRGTADQRSIIPNPKLVDLLLRLPAAVREGR